MKALLIAMALSVTVLASGASAQGVNLSGPWQCVALCLAPPGGIAYITQYRWDPKCPGRSAIESLDRLSGSYLVPNRQPGCNLFARRPHDSI